MITNILATAAICLTTNVVESNNSKGCATWQGIADNHWALYHADHPGCGPYSPPTRRTFTTNISEVTTWTFHCPDHVRTLTETRILSKVETVLEQAWAQQSVRDLTFEATNVPPFVVMVATNWGIASNDWSAFITNLIITPTLKSVPQRDPK